MRWLLLFGLISLVVTCGQKGPLTLPDSIPAASAAPLDYLSDEQHDR